MSRITFGSRLIQRESNDDTHDVVTVDQIQQLAHREALPGAPGERGERLCEGLCLVGEGETGPFGSPVDCKDPTPCRHPCDIVW